MLACVAGVKDHEAKKVCDDLSIGELVRKLVSQRSAFGASLASLLFVLGLDCIDEMLGGKVLLVELFDLDSHVVKTLEIHSLSLRMPNFLPLALRFTSESTTLQEIESKLTCVNRHSSSFCFNRAKTIGSTAHGSLKRSATTSGPRSP